MSVSRINNHQIHTRLYQRCNPVVGICANTNTGGNPQLALFVFTRGGKGFGLGYGSNPQRVLASSPAMFAAHTRRATTALLRAVPAGAMRLRLRLGQRLAPAPPEMVIAVCGSVG